MRVLGFWQGELDALESSVLEELKTVATAEDEALEAAKADLDTYAEQLSAAHSIASVQLAPHQSLPYGKIVACMCRCLKMIFGWHVIVKFNPISCHQLAEVLSCAK